MSASTLLGRASAGDGAAFGELIEPFRGQLRSFIYRFVAHPEDTDDVLQEVLLKAFQRLADFRGDSALKTWVFGIAHRACVDHLRSRPAWPVDAQIRGETYSKGNPAELEPIESALAAPDSTFDFREHIAFCFSCVGRSLPSEEQSALLLVEVMGFTYREAAKICEVSEAVLRHRLSAARSAMVERFHGLCALVNKNGACYQCNVLRDAAPAALRGPVVEDLGAAADSADMRLSARLAVVRDADLMGGSSRPLHATLLRLLGRMAGDGASADGQQRRRQSPV